MVVTDPLTRPATAGENAGRRKNKSKGKTQIAKGKSKTPETTSSDDRSPCCGFAFCVLPFDFLQWLCSPDAMLVPSPHSPASVT